MPFNKVMDEFHTTYLMKDVAFDERNAHNMYKLALSEMTELHDELTILSADSSADNRNNIVKESLDVVYVITQRLRQMGVDVGAAFAEVHRSNMSKALPLDGSVNIDKEIEIARERYPHIGVKYGQRKAILLCGETGKVIKPTTYSSANITKEMIGA